MNYLLLTFTTVILVLSFQKLRAQPTKINIDSLLNEIARAPEDTNKVKMLLDAGKHYEYSDGPKALSYAKPGYDLAKNLYYPIGIARLTYLMGNIYLNTGDYKNSWAMLNEADSVFQSLGRMVSIAAVNNAKGTWYYLQGDNWNASYHMNKMAEIYHKLKDTVREAVALQNLTACLIATKNYDKAVSISKKTLQVFRARNDSLKMIQSLQHQLYVYTETGKLNEAAEMVSMLHPILVAAPKNHTMSFDTYHFIGQYYFKRARYDSAMYYYELAYESSPKSDYTNAVNYGYRGETYLFKNELPQAKEWLTKSLDLALASNSKDIYYKLSLRLSEYYLKVNDHENAIKYLQQYTKLNDSILVADTRQYSTQLEAVYENNRKENEILRLKAEELNQSLAIRKRNNYLYAALALLFATGVFFTLKSRNDKNKRKLLEQDKKLKDEKILSMEKEQQVTSLQSMITGQETERSRIARDLHDGLGGLFSTVKMYFNGLQLDQPGLATNPLFIKSFELADNAAVEIRRIAHNLMPEVLIRLGLVNAVQDLCNNINVGRLLKISLQSYGMEERLAANVEIMLYRIVQELLNNIIKHAQATEVIIQFNKHTDRLTITIEDNGRGFNLDEAVNKNNAGINTIKSRVNYLNGELNIDSRQGVGTTVIMEFLMDTTSTR